MAKRKKGSGSGDGEDPFKALGAIPLSSADALSKVNFSVSTGSIVMDAVLAGGRPFPCSLVPFGRQMELSGLPSVGKSSACAMIAASTQAAGGDVWAIDTEERIDAEYWKVLGVDIDLVQNLQCRSIEEVFNKIEKVIKYYDENKKDTPLLIIWDSVGGTSSEGVLDGDGDLMERAKKMYGREAKLIGTGVKALNPLLAKTKSCLLYTNHLYTDMNVTYGDNKKEYGGLKLRHYATVSLRLVKTKSLYEEDKFGNRAKIGQKVKIVANKNSLAPKEMEKEAVIIDGKGFNNDYTVFELGKKADLISTAGAWSTAVLGGEEVKFQGWNGFKEKVMTHEKYPELVKAMMEAL